jgi:hypothetical protein
MNRRSISMAITAALVLGALTVAPAQAGGVVRTSDSYTVTFFDDYIFELCGIETETTLTERFTLLEFANGWSTLTVRRTFVPADKRIPIEKGQGTSINRADGSRIVLGTPIHLISQVTGKTILKDTGLVEFDPEGNVVRMIGPHPSLTADLADYYCP